ncbi:unnamed protein product [Arabidopsis thaliana]|uniref:Transmembrane protein n=1 Tax=Arabidopsis thaliana TaxID=3702 RepID=A0A654EJ63_ARATH|nr:unnamed protein product [Arabidopsis thaliana]VYS49366.1 unnamed protein product [Arabidopsis thaliana]
MREISISTITLSWSHLLLCASICLHFFLGISGDPNSTSTGAKAESHTSSSKTGTKVIFILLGFGAVAGLSFFLYKLWQKKKRDEQYARLLKLFEEDDELEVELGLRD